jgi:hypothetical protein
VTRLWNLKEHEVEINVHEDEGSRVEIKLWDTKH